MTPVQAKSILLRLCANYPALVVGVHPLCSQECEEIAAWIRQELWDDKDAKEASVKGTPWCDKCEDFHPASDYCQIEVYPGCDNCLCSPCICANDLKNRYEKFPWLDE